MTSSDAGKIEDLPTGLLIEANPDGIVVIDSRGILRYMNPRAEEVLRRWPGASVGRSFPWTLASEGPTEIAFAPTRAGEQAIIVEAHVSSATWQGEPLTIASLRDVTTARREHETLLSRDAALRTMMQKLSAVLNVLPHALALVDGFGRIRLVNRTWSETYSAGVIAGAHIPAGLNFVDYCRAASWLKDCDTHANGIAQTARGEQPSYRFEYEQRRLDGPRYFSVLATHIQLDGLGGAVIVHQDVTDDRQIDEERRYLASLLEFVSDAVISTDDDYRIRSWNHAATRMYGWQADEVIGRPIDEVLGTGKSRQGGDPKTLAELVRAGSWQGDFMQAAKDGRPLNVHASVVSILNAVGDSVGVVAVNRNMSEVRQREREVAAIARIASTLRTEGTAAGIVDALITTARSELGADMAAVGVLHPESGRLAFYNAVGLCADVIERELLGETGITAGVMTHRQLFVSKDLGMEPGLSERHELPERFAGAAMPLLSQGKVLGVVWLGRLEPLARTDVSVLEAITNIAASALHRIHLFEQVQQQAGILQRTLDSLEDGVVVLDHTLRPVTVNQAAQALLNVHGGFDGDKLVALGSSTVGSLLDEPGPASGADIVAGVDGATTLTVYTHSLRRESHPAKWVLVVRDVSDERDLQVRLREQERLAAVGQLAAGIAHDFNNVMTSIILYAQMLRRVAGLDERSIGRIDTILAQAEHAGNLIQQILDYGRRSVIEQRTFDLTDVIDRLITLWRRTLPETIQFDINIAGNGLYISGDQTRIQQALMNLVVNARDAMESGGTLSITVEPIVNRMSVGDAPLHMTHARVAVADTGTGIPLELREHIFEPFFTTKQAGRGTGLGLSQVYGIMQQHGGKVDVESELGVGSKFVLTMPLVDAPQVLLTEGLSSVAEERTFGEEITVTLLLVEDNEATRRSLSEGLGERGYRVLAAEDGASALALLDERSPSVDWLITDFVLPDMDGIMLAEEVLQREPDIRYLVMSGYPLTDEAARQKTVTWIKKPFFFEQLIDILRRPA